MARPMQDCVILFGDSLTQRMDSPRNLHQRMAEAYQRKLDTLNRGFGGYNTILAKPTFDQIFARKSEASTAPEVRLVTIWFGTNDATLPPLPQSTPLPTFLANLNHFLTSLTSPSSPYAVTDTPVSIILITPPPIVRGMMEVGKRGDRTPERTREFRDAVLKLGSDWGESGKGRGIGWKVATVDLWGAIMRAAGANDEGEDRGEEEEEGLRPFFIDGVHLSSLGYDVLWADIERVIKVDFKGRGLDWDDFDDLPRRFPWFRDIDFERPESVVERMALPAFRRA